MAAHRLYPLWVHGEGKRSAERSSRGQISNVEDDLIDQTFLKYRWDELFESEFEDFGRARVEDKQDLYANKIVGIILNEFSGSWDGPLHEFDGGQRCMQLDQGLVAFDTFY